MKNTHFDIIIIGAGLVGTSLVCALADLGLSIAVLENHLLDTSKPPSPNGRPISLSHSSYNALKNIGIWDDINDQSCAIESVHVSEQGTFGRLKIQARDYDIPALGYVVPFDFLRHALYKKTSNTKNVTIICTTQLQHIKNDSDTTSVTFTAADTEKTYTCDLLVAADGAQSHTRELLGIGFKETDHHELALTATLTLNTQLKTGFERFTEHGIIAVLPRPDKTAGLVWSVKSAMIDTVKAWDDAALQTFIQEIFGRRIGTIKSVKRNAMYPLITRTADTQYKHHAVLLGNSAHTFYPIAAQGFNLSLRDATQLAAIIRFAHGQKTLTDSRLLSTYLHLRKEDQARVQKIISSTAFCFDLDIPAFGALRGASLLAADIIKPLKNRLAKRSLGISGRIKKVSAFYEG
jgi:2-octaprenyl-6-methoxyphenol hydroxylase